MIKKEEYEYNKRELLSEIEQPFIMHNPKLARDFFELLKNDLPDVQFFEKKDSPREVAAQYITAGDQARAELLGVLTRERKNLEEELQELYRLIGEISGRGATS